MDILRVLEKQSGFLRLIWHLSNAGEVAITSILKDTNIPVHQLYSSIDKGKTIKLLNTRIDRSAYPARNMISLTEKGIKIAEKIREMLKIMESD